MSIGKKFEEAGTITKFETMPPPTIWVAVYYYKECKTPSGMTFSSKESLITSFTHMTGIDESKPVKIYKIEL